MSDLLEAIKSERHAETERHKRSLAAAEENHRARLALLDEAERLAKSLNGGDPTSASPPQAQTSKSPPKRPAPAKKAKAKKRQAPKASPPKAPDLPPPPLREPPKGGGGVEAAERREAERADAVKRFLGDHPQSNMRAILDAMAPTYKDESVRLTVKRLLREKVLRTTGIRRGTRYLLADSSTTASSGESSRFAGGKRDTKAATTADGDGARTEQERKVVEVLREGPRPAAGLGVKLSMRMADLDRILASLVVRGVLERYKDRDVAAPLFKIKGT